MEDRQPGVAELPAEARRLHSRVYIDSEEAELRAPESRPRPADERY